MNETENCPPWKRKKVTQQSSDETRVVSHHVPEYKIWIPDRLNHVIAELTPDARETLALCRTVMGIMNKLTWENFEKLSENMKNLRIDTPAKIQLVVDVIHKRAVVESKYRFLYVKMCDVLRRAQASDDRNSVPSFSTCLIAKCEEFFTQGLRQDDYFYERKKAIDSCVDKILKKSGKEAYELEESVFRKNLMGNCEFTGELYNMKIIHSGIILDMLNRLSKATLFVAVQGICTLITTVGLFYEEKIGKFPEKYFDKLKSVLKSDNVPVWVHYHIRELLDLRYHNWRPRKMINSGKPAPIASKERIPKSKPNRTTIPQKRSVQEFKVEQETSPPKKRDQELKTNQEIIPLKDLIQILEKNLVNASQKEHIQATEINPAISPQKEHTQESNLNQECTPQNAYIQESKMNQDEVQLPPSFEDRVCKALDALTPHNIEIQIVTMTPIVDVFQLEYLADVIFRKAIRKPKKCKLYVKLCNIMGNFRVPIEDNESRHIEFKTVLRRYAISKTVKALLAKCQKLLDELGTKKLEKNKSKICRKVPDNWQFIIELSKAKFLTPEFNFHLCIKLIESGIQELLEFVRLRDLLKINGKEILLKLKEQSRYEELFLFFDKLHHVSKIEKKWKSTTLLSYLKTNLRKFTYGIENECCVVQDIVHLGPILSVKEFTSTTLFWYLRVFFNECLLEAKKAPEWVSSQKRMFSSGKALREAISQFLKYAMSGNDFIAARSGRFFIYLIKWDLISPQDVIDGLSISLKSIIMRQKKRNLQQNKRDLLQKKRDFLKKFTSLLFESGYFKFNDLKMILPKDLVPSTVIKNEEIEIDIAPISPVANEPMKPETLIQGLIQLQLSFEDRVRKALDELTPSNIENQIFLMIPLVNEPQFVYVVNSIFQNAIFKPYNCELYARLCYDMWSFRAPIGDDESSYIEFKTVVLSICHLLLNESVTRKLDGQIRTSVGEEKNEICEKATGNFRLIFELSKLKVFTPEFMFLLIIKLIDLRNEELFDWLSELLPTNWKTILLTLKEQARYDEIFQFFDKLEHLLKDENYNSTSDIQWKSAFTKFVYGVENECFIQEIVYEGAITSLKEFTPTTLFWYLKVCFNHCRLEAKKAPEWVSSQKKVFRFSKALPPALSQFNMSIDILNDNFVATRAGRFFVYLIKWDLISPQYVIDGLSCILKLPVLENPEQRKRLKRISRHLLCSGYFEFDDLKMILLEDSASNPANKNKVQDTQIPTTSPKTSHVKSETENGEGNFETVAIIPQLAETFVKRQMLEKFFLDASKYVPPSPYHFDPVEFKSQINGILFDVEDLETAASCLIEVVMKYPDLYEFYATVIFSSIFRLTFEKTQFWKVLITMCSTYCDRMLFSSDGDENSTPEKETSMTNELITEPPPMAVIVTDSTAQGQDFFKIYVPTEALNKINDITTNLTESFCPLCSLKTKAGDAQLDKINKKYKYYRAFMAHLRKRVSVQPILQSSHSVPEPKNRCTIYLSRDLLQLLMNTAGKDILPVCFSCGFRIEALNNLKLKMECIDEVLEWVNFQVGFKLDDRPLVQTVKKSTSIEKKALCRFFSKLVNMLNNKVADTTVQHQMRSLLIAHRIDYFCEIYYHLNWNEHRFEKSLFAEKIPEVLSNDDLEYEHREMLDGVLKNYFWWSTGGAREKNPIRKCE